MFYKTNMLVLRTSNFQGATIKPIVPKQSVYCLHCSPLNFLPLASPRISTFLDESRLSQM